MFQFPEWHKINFEEWKQVMEEVIFIKSVEDTESVIQSPAPKIVIAASGMLAGGRILHYLKDYLPEKRNTLLLVGFQAEGTRGKAVKEGAHEVKIHGRYYTIKADVRELSSLSAHADQSELLHWIERIPSKPESIFLVHGENDALYPFQLKIKDQLGLKATIPSLYEEWELFHEE
jgi:metallo-beta-lactamase family protein